MTLRRATRLSPSKALFEISTERVAMLREDGCRELLLARRPNSARTLKSHNPQAVAAGLEREIRALGGKIDRLAHAAINPETFERIRRQTEEVRNLLAAAATRTAPVERLERQISEPADRVERLGASPAPHVESAEMAASLAYVRDEIERAAPLRPSSRSNVGSSKSQRG